MTASGGRRSSRAGLTLIELIVAFSILLILSTMALPMTKMKVQREKERRLRMALEEMRTAIDRYKDAADKGLLGEQDPDNHGYPESLDILVDGVEVASAGAGGMAGAMGGMGGQQQGMGGSLQPSRMGGSRGSGFGGAGGSAFGGSGGSNFGGGSSFGGKSSGGFGSSSRGGSSRMKNSTAGNFGSGGAGEDDDEPKTMRFLRKIPVDPITGRADWGMRSVSDSPDSMSWGGGNVFDVFSMSMDTALDGTRYSDW